jgi:tRNA threonylcarbamoyl adenosine modification protein YjeE
VLFQNESRDEFFLFLKKNKFSVFFLFGEIGAGKTTFVRDFLQNNSVTSPTFNICHQYGDIFHFDLYRLEITENKLISVGFFEAIFNHMSFIEWSEKLFISTDFSYDFTTILPRSCFLIFYPDFSIKFQTIPPK